MSLARSLNSYGAPYADAVPIDNPETTESSAYHNRLTEDVAQGTRTWSRAKFVFATRTTNGSCAVSWGQSMQGVGSAQLPTVARTSAGVYAATFPTSWNDALGGAESIVFNAATACVQSTTTVGRAQCSPSSNVINVLVLSNVLGVDTPSDLTGGASILVDAT